ncbi:MAG: hypothetical protein MUC53_00080 [Candidatus Contendobacter sp.]|jgi:hypothetical protein|nr:hypothetical protein [Candidatus Contendobacter sp.]
MARIPCKSSIPAWSLLYSSSESLALDIAEIIWGFGHLLFDDETELLWDDGTTGLLWG